MLLVLPNDGEAKVSKLNRSKSIKIYLSVETLF